MTDPDETKRLRERLQGLAILWRVAIARGPHPSGCTCMGHFLIPAMNARDMEADILDFMRHRYAQAGLSDLVALLDARATVREATDIPPTPFRGWLLTIADAPVRSLDRFIDDLTDTLESFAPHSQAATPASGFLCT